MLFFKSKNVHTAISDLLDREHRAILNSDFNELQRLLPEKERLLTTSLKDISEDRIIDDLRERSLRNNSMLDALASGVRAAGNVLKNRPVSSDFGTYDESGAKSRHVDESSSMELKA